MQIILTAQLPITIAFQILPFLCVPENIPFTLLQKISRSSWVIFCPKIFFYLFELTTWFSVKLGKNSILKPIEHAKQNIISAISV